MEERGSGRGRGDFSLTVSQIHLLNLISVSQSVSRRRRVIPNATFCNICSSHYDVFFTQKTHNGVTILVCPRISSSDASNQLRIPRLFYTKANSFSANINFLVFY